MNRKSTIAWLFLGLILLSFGGIRTASADHALRITHYALLITHYSLRATSPTWSATSNMTGTLLGWAVASAGDVNGDGYGDLIVGAPRYSHGETEEGAAFLYLGGPGGPSAAPDWMGESDQAHTWFGSSVASAGDVNGDGYGDLIVGAARYDVAGPAVLTDTGQVFLYYGGPTGILTGTLWTAHIDQPLARFGSSVASAGDVNGDGYGDLIVTATGYDGQATNEGAAFLYLGGPDGPGSYPVWTVHPTSQAYADFGRSASTAGDVNGDGYSDVVIGAPWYDTGAGDEERDRGAAFLYLGGPGGLSSYPAWTVMGDRQEAEFGIAVSTAGDVNGDGYSDLIVGAYKYTEDYLNPWREGAAFLYYGGAGGLSTAPAWEGRGGQTGARFGLSVSGGGDMDGDGYTEAIVGAYSYDSPYTNTGRVLIYGGGADGLTASHIWSAEGDQEGEGLGYSVAAAWDVNGDGYGDIVAGAPTYNDGQMDEGGAFLYSGSGDDDLLAARPRQLRAADLSPIASLGLADSTSRVHLQLTIQPTLAITAAALQWQVAPPGVPFTAAAAISGSSPTWSSVLSSGVILSQTVTGLSAGTPYRWRVRALYRPAGSSRWLSPPWNGAQEIDFRTPLLLGPDRNIYLEPGQAATTTMTLFNPAGQTQTFTLTCASSPGYTVTVAAPAGGLTATLPPFDRSPITVAVQTAPTTSLGTRYTTIITTSSELSGQSTAHHVTTVAELVFLPLVMESKNLAFHRQNGKDIPGTASYIGSWGIRVMDCSKGVCHMRDNLRADHIAHRGL